MIWHSSDIKDVLNKFEVDDKKGLANGVADMRLEEVGKNVIAYDEQPSYFSRFLSQLKSKMVIILIVTALLSFCISLIYREVNSYSALLIIGIVIINALVSAYHVYNCDKMLNAMRNITNPQASVIRDGIIKTISSEDLVPGDIILLEEGDYITADARIIECTEFRCNEAAITGEEVPADKKSNIEIEDIAPIDKRQNMVYTGCSVVHGTAKAVVVATGLNTEIGHSTTIMRQTNNSTLPLQKELDNTGKIVNMIVLAVCVIVFIIGMIQNFSSGRFASMTLQMIVNSVALAVAAIPEGLPAIATIVMAVGIERMLKDNIIVKDASALELLGKTSVICSDKTGILTRNKMKVLKIFDGKNIIDVDNEQPDENASMILRLAAIAATLENDSTEYAIEKACLAYNSVSKQDIEGVFPRLAKIPFDAERKTMTSINMINQHPVAIIKGAPEIVVPNCINCDVEAVLKVNDQLANDALRIVCIAMKPLDAIPANPNSGDIECDMHFVGLIGIIDPPRDTAIEDIACCDKAGIRTIMITGDNMNTAKAIARRIGILKDGTLAISGAELSEMSDEELARNIKKYTVFARVSPDDKLRIVKAYQKHHMNITITGDSINDADALATADVGCVMGKFGTDIAKGNADIIISNNKFDSIVYAVKESRGLFSNIKKSVHYLLSCNFAELLSVIIGLIAFKGMPIAAVQLLWINLLTDCAPAISLSMERAEASVMNYKPKSAFGKIFDMKSTISMLIQSIFITGMTLLSYVIGNRSGTAVAMTMAFATLGMSQIFHCINNKFFGTIFNKKILSNSFMNMSVFLTLFIIIFLLLSPAGYVFGLTVLTTKQFLLTLLFSVLIIPLTELLKLIERLIKN